MTFNFAMQAIDQIINSAAKTHYMSGGIQNPLGALQTQQAKLLLRHRLLKARLVVIVARVPLCHGFLLAAATNRGKCVSIEAAFMAAPKSRALRLIKNTNPIASSEASMSDLVM